MNFINKKIVDIGFIPFENVKTNNESEQKGVITLEPDLDNNAGVLVVLFYDTPTLAQYTPDSSLRFLVLRNSEYDRDLGILEEYISGKKSAEELPPYLRDFSQDILPSIAMRMLKPRYKEESSEGLPKGVNGKEIREYYEKNLIDPESMKELASNNLPKGYLK